MRVNHKGGHRVVRLQQLSDGAVGGVHAGVTERCGAESGRVARLQHRRVAQRQRCLQFLQPRHQQLAAGVGTAAFYKAQVALRHAHAQRQLQLAEATRMARLLQSVLQ